MNEIHPQGKRAIIYRHKSASMISEAIHFASRFFKMSSVAGFRFYRIIVWK